MTKTFNLFNQNGLKGQNGTVIVVGGSEMYTGAPLFASLGALRSGSELVYVFTAEKAVSTIKQIPELIVMPFEFIPRILEKATACIVGPGLGRVSECDMAIIMEIVTFLNSKNVPFVLDADSIHYYKTGIFTDLTTVVLTPNYKETQGLVVKDTHVCVYKGKEDVLASGSTRLIVDTPSSRKRCGGQGDILSGILATMLTLNKENILEACADGCKLLRASTLSAFQRKGFSLITSDIFDDISEIIRSKLHPY